MRSQARITVTIILSACRLHGCVERVSIPVPTRAAPATTPHSRPALARRPAAEPRPRSVGAIRAEFYRRLRGRKDDYCWQRSCTKWSRLYCGRVGRKRNARTVAAAPSPEDSSQPDGVSRPVHSAAANAGVKRFCAEYNSGSLGVQ